MRIGHEANSKDNVSSDPRPPQHLNSCEVEFARFVGPLSTGAPWWDFHPKQPGVRAVLGPSPLQQVHLHLCGKLRQADDCYLEEVVAWGVEKKRVDGRLI